MKFPCSARPEWFDSSRGRESKDVRKALRLCAGCPFQLACRTAGRNGREYGIWGGETEPERLSALGMSASTGYPECGTAKGTRLHERLGETCEECSQAEEARRATLDEFTEIPGSRVNPFHAPLRPVCGTKRGYRAHIKRSELQLAMHPDCTCKEAWRQYQAEQRAARAAEKEQVDA
ncbi:WhiB family transcriptional regulator [Streptomyces cellulosae]